MRRKIEMVMVRPKSIRQNTFKLIIGNAQVRSLVGIAYLTLIVLVLSLIHLRSSNNNKDHIVVTDDFLKDTISIQQGDSSITDETSSIHYTSNNVNTSNNESIQTPSLSWEEQLEQSRDYLNSFQSLDRKLTFFHIPKTAGTAVEYAAGTKRVSWGSCLFKHKPKRGICRYPEGAYWPVHVGWWHLPAHLFPLANANPYQNAELFGVIRDPYDRMVSEFYYICTLRVFEWRPNQCDRKRLFEQSYMNSWLLEKLKERDRGTAIDYLMDNGHFTPQYEFVFGPHEVRMLDYVLQMEDLSNQFERLMNAFNLDHIQLEKRNAIGAAANREDSEKQYLDVHHLHASTVQAIHNEYPNDFEIGSYSMQE